MKIKMDIASKVDRDNGWSLPYDFLERVQDKIAGNSIDIVSLETIEDVLLASAEVTEDKEDVYYEGIVVLRRT